MSHHQTKMLSYLSVVESNMTMATIPADSNIHRADLSHILVIVG